MVLTLGLLLLFAVIFLANRAAARPDASLGRFFHWLLLLSNLPLYFMGLALAVLPDSFWVTFTKAQTMPFQPQAGAAVLLAIALWGTLVSLPPARRALARFLPINPASPVHTLALVMAGYLGGNTLLTLSQGGLEGLAEAAEAASVVTFVSSELLLVAVAAAGVGLFSRRSGQQVVARLGLTALRPRQLVAGMGWVAVMVVTQGVVGAAWFIWQPQQAELLESVNTLLLQDIDSLGEWFALALAAAVGEEILFRGALQPVLGLLPTAALFALAHVQYGLTPVTVFVLILGLVLGLIRRRWNTSLAIVVHFSYNFTLGLLSLLVAAVT
ncbi:MAG: CPBP family intramembrane glutamic endopeptidase [Chloroflexota bacterium]